MPYRDIDLLLGCKGYGPSIDIWSVGCVMAEVYGVRGPLFDVRRCPNCRHDMSFGQIISIVVNLGLPTEITWPGISERPDFQELLKVIDWLNVENNNRD